MHRIEKAARIVQPKTRRIKEAPCLPGALSASRASRTAKNITKKGSRSVPLSDTMWAAISSLALALQENPKRTLTIPV